MIEWFTTHFAPGPLFGWVCALAAVMIPLVWLGRASVRRRAPIRYSALDGLRGMPATWAIRLRPIVPLLRTGAIVALVVVLARPQAGGAYRDTSEGIAIQMVLDVSGSMSQADFAMGGKWVRRVDAVKAVFREFVLGRDGLGGRPNDLIGMTTFALYAQTPCPLTRDHASLTNLLDETDIPGWVRGVQRRETEESNFTSLGDAIALATDDLRRAGEQAVAGVPGAEPAKSRVMILLTDGANNPPKQLAATAPDPLEAASVAAKLGVKIYTIGAIGSEQAGAQGFMFPMRRAEVDEPALQEIAKITNGQYFRATDAGSLATIYQEIDQLERRSTGERMYRDDTVAAQIAMITALGLVLAELLLVTTRLRRVP